MANQLIDQSRLDEEARQPGLREAREADAKLKAPPQEKGMPDPRCFLYRSDCLKGEIFEGEEAIAVAVKNGWVDSPAGLGENPGPAPEVEPEPLEESEPEAPAEEPPAEDSEDVSE